MSLSASAARLVLGKRRVLDGIDFQAASGHITAVIGPNGAGKSTLLRALAGLVALDAGSISVAGRALASYPQRELARTLAYLPQDRTVHWPLTARAVVALGRLPHHDTRAGENAADVAAIEEAMRRTDVAALADRSVAELSGGERARVLCARALAQEAPILLADEPSAGLDPAHALQLFGVLSALAAEGRTIVVALHDLSIAARFCHHVVLLLEGRVLAAGAPHEVMAAQHMARAFGVSMGYGSMDGVPIVMPLQVLDGNRQGSDRDGQGADG